MTLTIKKVLLYLLGLALITIIKIMYLILVFLLLLFYTENNNSFIGILALIIAMIITNPIDESILNALANHSRKFKKLKDYHNDKW